MDLLVAVEIEAVCSEVEVVRRWVEVEASAEVVEIEVVLCPEAAVVGIEVDLCL